jgi:hypothetical protein
MERSAGRTSRVTTGRELMSPLDVESVDLDITATEIVQFIREGRRAACESGRGFVVRVWPEGRRTGLQRRNLGAEEYTTLISSVRACISKR